MPGLGTGLLTGCSLGPASCAAVSFLQLQLHPKEDLVDSCVLRLKNPGSWLVGELCEGLQISYPAGVVLAQSADKA